MKQLKKDHETSRILLNLKNENNKNIGKYINARTKVKCQCRVCKNIWFANPDCLINRNSGCPECSKKKSIEKRSKPVVQCSMNGEIIKKYDSSKEAERETGIFASNIAKACSGRNKSAGGFRWKRVE